MSPKKTAAQFIVEVLEKAAEAGNPVMNTSEIAEGIAALGCESSPNSVRTVLAEISQGSSPSITKLKKNLYRKLEPFDESLAEETILVELRRLIDRALESGGFEEVDGYESSGLAIVDAVFSQRARYQSVMRIVNRVRKELGSSSVEGFSLLGLLELIGEHYECAPTEVLTLSDGQLEDFFDNHTKVLGGTKAKARVVVEACEQLLTIQNRIPSIFRPLSSKGDFHELMHKKPEDRLFALDVVQRDLLEIKGMGIATVRYFLLLLGLEFVKPDRMLIKWVQSALGSEAAQPTPLLTAQLLETAILKLREEGYDLTFRDVDYLVWTVASRRRNLPMPEAAYGDQRNLRREKEQINIGEAVDWNPLRRNDIRWHGVCVGLDERRTGFAIVSWTMTDSSEKKTLDGKQDLDLPYYTVEPFRYLHVCEEGELHPARNVLQETP